MTLHLNVREVAKHFAESDEPAFTRGALTIRGDVLMSYAEEIAVKFPGKVAWVTSETFSKTTTIHTHQALVALDRAGYRVVRSKSARNCLHCGQPRAQHADTKCLFDSTTYLGTEVA